jgi:uncharacterized membrane protein YdjX (TVP38/TMEM64 family)
MKHKKKVQIGSFISLIVTIFLVIFISRNLQNVEIIIKQVGIFGPIFVVILYGLLSVTPIATDSLTLICGAIYGPFGGAMIGWMGNNLAALIEYLVGRQVGSLTEFHKQKQKLPWGLSKFPTSSIWFLTLGRLIPGYGGKLVSFAGGLDDVPIGKYIWTTVIMNLIGSIILAFAGFGIIKAI